MQENKVKAKELNFKYELDTIKSKLNFTVESKESQDIMFSIFDLMEKYRLLKYGNCEVTLGEEFYAPLEYIDTKEHVIELLSASIKASIEYEKEPKLIRIPGLTK